MGNCLVTKLKSEVNIDNPQYFDSVCCFIPRNSGNAYITDISAIDDNISKVYFVESEGQQIAPVINNTVVGEYSEGPIYIPKYISGQIIGISTIVSVSTPLEGLNIRIHKASNLISLMNTYGDVSNALNCPRLRNLIFNSLYNVDDYKVYGNIEDLVPLEDLVQLKMNSIYVEGSATIFIDNFPNLQLLDLHDSNIADRTAETKAAIEATHPGISINW